MTKNKEKIQKNLLVAQYIVVGIMAISLFLEYGMEVKSMKYVFGIGIGVVLLIKIIRSSLKHTS